MLRVSSMLTGGGARRIVIAGSVLIVIAILGGVLSIRDLRSNAIDASRQNMSNLGIVLAEQLSRSMQAVDLVLDETVQHVARSGAATSGKFHEQLASEATHACLVNRMHALPQASAIFLTDEAGREINSSNFWPVVSVDHSDRDFFRAARSSDAQALIINPPSRSQSTGRWALFLSRRLESRAGVFLGTVQAAVELRYFEEFYKTLTLPEGASVRHGVRARRQDFCALPADRAGDRHLSAQGIAVVRPGRRGRRLLSFARLSRRNCPRDRG
jgi:hypothetical protein